MIAVMIRQRLGFISSSFFFFFFLILSILSTSEPWNPSSASLACLFIGKWALGAMEARPGELSLSHEAMSSPRRASYLTLKSFVARASQRLAWASQGPGKPRKRPFFSPFMVSLAFLIETLNGPLLCTVTSVQHRKSTRKDQKINERQSPEEIRV